MAVEAETEGMKGRRLNWEAESLVHPHRQGSDPSHLQAWDRNLHQRIMGKLFSFPLRTSLLLSPTYIWLVVLSLNLPGSPATPTNKNFSLFTSLGEKTDKIQCVHPTEKKSWIAPETWRCTVSTLLPPPHPRAVKTCWKNLQKLWCYHFAFLSPKLPQVTMMQCKKKKERKKKCKPRSKTDLVWIRTLTMDKLFHCSEPIFP